MNKPDINRCYKFLQCDMSLITVGENKIPNFPWKKYMTVVSDKDDFKKSYDYSGGIIKKDGTEIKPTTGIGLVTGFNNLEVIDIDLKVFKSLAEQQSFWNEFTTFLKDHIDDFDEKFVIYKTINNGYHILYRCAEIGGNVKIAKLEGKKEAIIETRGIGGYVFIYDNQVSKNSYFQIQEISIMDREALFGICRYYNYVEPEQPVKLDKVSNELNDNQTSVWEDYNSKVNIIDIISSDLSIVRNLSDKYILKRHGATSPHSGYVYKNSNCMYLFSTGTIYPNEKLITPFHAYTIKYHNSDFKASAKDLYQQGYGARVLKQVKELEEKIIIPKEDIVFPIDIFPEEIQKYLIKSHETLDSSFDYMGCSFLWVLSVIIGNSIKVKVKNGWIENCNTWFVVVGKAGIGKTPSISHIINPLNRLNSREVKKFIKAETKYLAYMELDKKEKQNTEEIRKPRRTQFIANDITLEALFDLHEENKNSLGVFRDELAGWFKDMNKYRSGSDLEHWLSSWSGKSVFLNRKTAKSAYVENPFISVLGGMQPNVMDSFYTEENKDNGFIDRMLLCYPDLIVENYNDNEISEDLQNWYNDYVISFFDGIRKSVVKYTIDDEIDPIIACFSSDAKVEWKRIFNRITDSQNSEEENEYMKSMLPKQKSYIPRFALLINSLNAFHDPNRGKNDFLTIKKEAILSAEKLSNYFILMAKKIKVNSLEVNDIKKFIKANDQKTTFEKFRDLYIINPDLNKTEVAERLGISRKTLYKYIEKCNPL